MNYQSHFAHKSILLVPVILSLFLVQCSNSPSASDRAKNADDMTGQAGTSAETDPLAANGGVQDHTTYAATPAGRERHAAVDELRAMRAQMMAELEAVRDRLNVGTQPEPQKGADKARAGELAQCLERTDRALALAEVATDENWTNAQDTTRRATNEVRTWWKEHRYPATAQVH